MIKAWRSRWGLGVGVVVAGLAAWLAPVLLKSCDKKGGVNKMEMATASPEVSASGTGSQVEGVQEKPKRVVQRADQPAVARVSVAPVVSVDDRSPLADRLLAKDGSGGEDAKVVYGLLEFYLKTFGGLPTAEDNPGFVRALSGANPRQLQILPPDHAAINARGELVDRHGTPYFFHLLAQDAVEVRSAGEDRSMWTEDDEIAASPRLRREAGSMDSGN